MPDTTRIRTKIAKYVHDIYSLNTKTNPYTKRFDNVPPTHTHSK